MKGRQDDRAPDQEEPKTEIVDRMGGLSEAHQKWLRDERGIDPDVAMDAGCYSATIQFAKGTRTEGFVTPCLIDGREKTWQARWSGLDAPMKRFVSGANARRDLFFGARVWEQDYLLCDFKGMKRFAEEDPSLVVVIHEGQLDALSSRSAGFEGLSMPNGAKSIDWVEAWAPKLANCRRVVVWLDNDEPGTEAREDVTACLAELSKSLWGNIYFVPDKFHNGKRVKDANDALRLGGVDMVREIVFSAKMRTAGQFNITPSRLEHHVDQFKTGIKWLDERLVLCAGEHTAIIGRTNRGKSKFANFLAYMAAKNNGERVYFQSFEAVADGELTADLAEMELGCSIDDILRDQGLYEKALDGLKRHVVAAEPSLVPKSKDPFGACLARIVEQACEGVRIHVIDNYSMVQTVGKAKNENVQTREDIIELNEVCRRYDVAAIMVYHARKGDPRFSTKNLPPEIEDASGSGAIGNHCCLGVSVERVMENDRDTQVANIAVRKARRSIHGKRCNFSTYWELEQCRYDFHREGFHGIEVAREKKNKGSAFQGSSTQSDDEGTSLL